MRRAAFIVLLALAIAGVSGPGSAQASAIHGSCPAHYLAEGTQSSYDPGRVNKALRGHFSLGIGFNPSLRPSMSWEHGRYHSANYLHRLYDLSWLDILVWTYRDPKHRYPHSRQNKALKEAEALAFSFVKADRTHNVKEGAAWLDRVAARRAEYLAYLARAGTCEHMLNRHQQSAFMGELKKHAHSLSHSDGSTANHRLSVQMSLAILGRQIPYVRSIAKAGRAATRRFHAAFHRGYDEDSGVWMENSPGYFGYALRLVDTWLGAVNPNDKDLLSARSKMKEALAWLTSTSGDQAQLGDTYLSPPLADVGAIASTQDGMWVAPKAGYAVVKSQLYGDYLVVSSSFQTWHHKHADDLSFELYDRQQRIVADTGQYDSTIGRYEKWEHSAYAHSTMTVDNQDFLWFWKRHRDKPKPYGSGILASGQGDGWYAILAGNPLTERQGVHHERLFLYLPGKVLVVYDMVHASSAHDYTRYFQLGPQVRANTLNASTLDLGGVAAKSLANWTSSATGAPKVVRGGPKPGPGWTYPGFREAEKRDTVSWTTHAKDMQSAAVFSLANSSPLSAIVGTPVGGDLALLTLSNGTVLSVARSGAALTVSALP